jgi:hypothetical protein
METMEEPAISYGEGTITPHSLPLLREVEPDQNSNQTSDEVSTLPTSQGILLHEPRVAEYTKLEVRVYSHPSYFQHSYARQHFLGGNVGA